MSTLDELIDTGDYNAAVEMLRRDRCLATVVDSRSLHLAAHHGSLEVTKLLIECGADVNLRDEDERTPLHYASDSKPAIVQLLLEHGANPNVTDRFGYTPLVWSILECQDEGDEIFTLLLNHRAVYELTAAAARGDVQQVRAIFEKDPLAISHVPSIEHLFGMTIVFAHRPNPPLQQRIDVLNLLFKHGMRVSRYELLKRASQCEIPEISSLLRTQAEISHD